MKIIVFVTQFYQLSGAEKLAIDFAKSAKLAGHDVSILSLYSSTHHQLANAAPSIEQQTKCPILYLGLPISPGVKDIALGVLRLRRILRQNNTDIIEASMVGPGTITALATIGFKTVYLLGIHAVLEKQIHRGMRFLLFKNALKINQKAKIYCISNAAKSAWLTFSNEKKRPCITIYNAISDEFISNNTLPEFDSLKQSLGIPSQAKIILFVGSLVKNKGIETALEAVTPFLKNDNCFFLLVGETGKIEHFNPGDEAYYQAFFTNAKPLEDSGRLKFLGHRADVANLMRISSVLIHPARSEGFGLVIAEALASGLPVVASCIGGIPEVVGNSSAAILCEPENVSAFRKGLETLLFMEDENRKKIQDSARLQASQFTQQKRTELLVSYAQENQAR